MSLKKATRGRQRHHNDGGISHLEADVSRTRSFLLLTLLMCFVAFAIALYAWRRATTSDQQVRNLEKRVMELNSSMVRMMAKQQQQNPTTTDTAAPATETTTTSTTGKRSVTGTLDKFNSRIQNVRDQMEKTRAENEVEARRLKEIGEKQRLAQQTMLAEMKQQQMQQQQQQQQMQQQQQQQQMQQQQQQQQMHHPTTIPITPQQPPLMMVQPSFPNKHEAVKKAKAKKKQPTVDLGAGLLPPNMEVDEDDEDLEADLRAGKEMLLRGG
jgi:type II secretory pathway pseudopilin PulG